MKNTKKQWRIFSFYAYDDMVARFEKMAEEGWRLVKITNQFFHYEKAEPAKVKYAVTYFAQASDFDPEITGEQQDFNAFCAAAGWQYVDGIAQMQIYCNENENPVPIETDPVVQVNTIHRAMKKNFVPSYILIMVLSVFVVFTQLSRIKVNPISALSDSSTLFASSMYILIAVMAVTDLYKYFTWHKKAEKLAQEGRWLASAKSTHPLQFVILAIVLSRAVIYFTAEFTDYRPVFLVAVFAAVGSTSFIAIGIKELLKKLKVPRHANMILTFTVPVVYTFVVIGCLVGYIVRNDVSITMGDSQPVDTYMWMDIEWDVYADNLPLTVENLLPREEINYSEYSYRLQENKSLFLSEYTARQSTRAVYNGPAPEMEYTIVKIHTDFLYGMCLDYMYGDMHLPYGDKVEPYYQSQLEEIPAADWQAEKAYRIVYEGQYLNRWLIAYEDRLVELRTDFDMSPQQINTAALRFKSF